MECPPGNYPTNENRKTKVTVLTDSRSAIDSLGNMSISKWYHPTTNSRTYSHGMPPTGKVPKTYAAEHQRKDRGTGRHKKYTELLGSLDLTTTDQHIIMQEVHEYINQVVKVKELKMQGGI